MHDSSRASSSDAIILFSAHHTKPLLKAAMSAVLATLEPIPGSFIDSLWVKRDVPFLFEDGRSVVQKRWVTYADGGAPGMKITGWISVWKSGRLGVFQGCGSTLG